MSWRELLSKEQKVEAPWTGGRELRAEGRTFKIDGRLPEEFGWHRFKIGGGRYATWDAPCALTTGTTFFDGIAKITRGYVVGDRLIPDGSSGNLEVDKIWEHTVKVWFIEPGLERFSRGRAGHYEDGRLIWLGQEFPQGPEYAVMEAFQDRKESVSDIPGVTPALDLAFRFESRQRFLLEERRRQLEEQRQKEERRRQLAEMRGTGAGRRALAREDYGAAAKAALEISGAELLDCRSSRNPGEFVVQFRFENRRFECVADQELHIVDAGICLTDHHTGEKGDSRFTLESLPTVIHQAIHGHRLHVYRHAGDWEDVEDEDDW